MSNYFGRNEPGSRPVKYQVVQYNSREIRVDDEVRLQRQSNKSA